MAYRCLFMDNGVYTAQDVNDALSNIVSAGISGYPFGSNAVAGLNEAIAGIANSGTQFKGTNCLLVNNNGTYKISEGSCFMADGSQIVFDSDGYVIEHQNGVYEYVYFERDVLHNTINVVVSDHSGGADTVPIAEIDTIGAVIDRRRFSKAKVSLFAEPQNIEIAKRITIPVVTSQDVETGFNGWKYIIYRDSSGPMFRKEFCIKLEDGGSIDAGVFPISNNGRYAHSTVVTRHGSVLHFEHVGTSSHDEIDVEIELR